MAERCLRYYENAANAGHCDAMLDLACLYLNGRGVIQSSGKALEWYQKAADLGSVTAFRCLGNYYMYYTHDDGRVVRGGPESDAETAYQYYVSGAALGCPTCLFELGTFYYEGRCVEQDDYLALQLYQASWDIVTEQREHDSYAEAHFHLGKCYHLGVSIGVNLDVAQGLLLSAVQESRRRVRDGDQGFQHVLDMALEEWAAVLRALDRQEAEQDKWRGGGQTDRQE